MGHLLILAGGTSSRMKKELEGSTVNSELQKQANEMPKGMIGVGKGGRPFLDYQLYNAAKAGFKEVVIVLNQKDTITAAYYESQQTKDAVWGLNIRFAIQKIPDNRIKPLGTADAVQQGLEQFPEWEGSKFTVCNSDNLYSSNAFQILLNNPYPAGLISYEASGLGFDHEKVKNCAILFEDKNGFLEKLIEKPTDNQILECQEIVGRLGISMNIFNLDYSLALQYMRSQPLNESRNEKEMPEAISRIAAENKGIVKAFPVHEFMPDLTSKTDLNIVQEYLEREFKEI
ncbi:MAG: sugar phosphate nucleotidyltransferase [Bacteroidota bacterium]